MYQLNKEFVVETAHILDSSYMTQCQRFHGHSARIVLSISSMGLNQDGMVIDFKKLKEFFQPIYDTLDHHCLVSEKRARTLFNDVEQGKRLGFVIVPFNPTAENLSKWIYEQVDEELSKHYIDLVGGRTVYVNYVEYWETTSACVRYDRNY